MRATLLRVCAVGVTASNRLPAQRRFVVYIVIRWHGDDTCPWIAFEYREDCQQHRDRRSTVGWLYDDISMRQFGERTAPVAFLVAVDD